MSSSGAKSETTLLKEFAENFGELTPRQLWTLVKFAKHIRLRARNNTAFNATAGRIFPYAKFRTVSKTRENYGRIETYPGLEITVKDSALSQDEEE